MVLWDKFLLYCFDFDGLLVDSERVRFDAYARACSELGVCFPFPTFSSFQNQLRGGSIAVYEILKSKHQDSASFPALWQTLAEKARSCYMESLGQVNLLPGVESLLKRLHSRGTKMCVVTNSKTQVVTPIRAHLEVLNLIPHWFTRETYREPKPAPEPYVYAREQVAPSTPAELVVGFEDSFKGILSIKSAGFYPVWVHSEVLNEVAAHPEMRDVLHISSFEEIVFS